MLTTGLGFHIMSRINLFFAGLMAACIGCSGPDSTVQGTVTIDGQLAPSGCVVFHPIDGGPTAYGLIANDGSYSARIGQGDQSDPDAGGVPSGDYVVTVVVNMPSRTDETVGEGGPPVPGARLTAAKYADKETSNLRATVHQGRNAVPLELEGAVQDSTGMAEGKRAASGAADTAAENAGGNPASASIQETVQPANSQEKKP